MSTAFGASTSFSFDAPITRKDAYMCPICLKLCAVGVQCSLCHRWYHTSSSSVDATTSGEGRPREACVPKPFLMPYFCAHCCQVAAGEVRRLSDNEGELLAHMTSDSRGSLIEIWNADEVLTGSTTRQEAEYEKWIASLLLHVANANSVTQSQRAEVQAEWTRCFTRNTLKRLRAHLAKNVSALYSAAQAATSGRGGSGGAAKDRALQLLPVEELDDATGKPFRDGADVNAATDLLIGGTALQLLQQSADAAITTQRRRWLGEQLEYANVNAPRSRVGRAIGGASVLGARSSGGFSASFAGASGTGSGGGIDAEADTNNVTGYLGGTGIRVSHITVQIDESDDDTTLSGSTHAHPF